MMLPTRMRNLDLLHDLIEWVLPSKLVGVAKLGKAWPAQMLSSVYKCYVCRIWRSDFG